MVAWQVGNALPQEFCGNVCWQLHSNKLHHESAVLIVLCGLPLLMMQQNKLCGQVLPRDAIPHPSQSHGLTSFFGDGKEFQTDRQANPVRGYFRNSIRHHQDFEPRFVVLVLILRPHHPTRRLKHGADWDSRDVQFQVLQPILRVVVVDDRNRNDVLEAVEPAPFHRRRMTMLTVITTTTTTPIGNQTGRRVNGTTIVAGNGNSLETGRCGSEMLIVVVRLPSGSASPWSRRHHREQEEEEDE